MNKYFNFFLGFFFIANVSLAQEVPAKKIEGKITADSDDLEGIYIVNLKTDKSTSSSLGGYFSICGSVGDTLLFSAVQFKGLKMVLTDKDLKKELLLVPMQTMVRRLDEVQIMQYQNINAVSLGLVAANKKKYTPAERRLKTAGDFKPINLLGIVGGGMEVDPILNALSGRTKMLQQELVVEGKEALLKKIDDYFGWKFFVEKLKIPEEYIKGFEYYLVEDEKFASSLKAKNKTMATFMIGELAVDYMKLLKGN